MKFLKYLFFLILISATGIVLYFATQDGSFEVTESRTIDAPAEVVFNFINDFKNWESFGSWMDDESLKINYPEVTSGVGASYSWNSEKDGKGAMQTLAVTPFESIEQKIVFNGSLQDEGYNVIWNFEPEDSGQKTLVNWSMKGELGLIEKIIFYVNDFNMQQMLSEMYAESLTKLETAITNELEAHSITVEGLSIHPGWFYISNTISTPVEEMETAIDQLIKRIKLFISDNNLKASGPHFVMYNTVEGTDNSLLITVGIPTSDFIVLPEDSDYFSGYIEESVAVKAILQGNYSHLNEARSEIESYITRNDLIKNESLTPFEVFVVTKNESNNPANWVTEIYIPVEHINDVPD